MDLFTHEMYIVLLVASPVRSVGRGWLWGIIYFCALPPHTECILQYIPCQKCDPISYTASLSHRFLPLATFDSPYPHHTPIWGMPLVKKKTQGLTDHQAFQFFYHNVVQSHFNPMFCRISVSQSLFDRSCDSHVILHCLSYHDKFSNHQYKYSYYICI